jgi:hypothetical protein
MKRKWLVYVTDRTGRAYEWRRCWTRRGAERSAREFTMMPAYLLPMTPIIVRAEEMDRFAAAYEIVNVEGP